MLLFFSFPKIKIYLWKKCIHDYESFCDVNEYDYNYLALLTNVIEYDHSKQLSTTTKSTITPSSEGLDAAI